MNVTELIARCAVVLALSGTTVAASETLRQQIQEVELQVEMLRRYVPIASSSQAETETFVQERARRLGLRTVSVTPVESEPATLENGDPSPVEVCRMEVSGQDLFDNVQLLIDSIARAPRIIDFETLTIAAASRGDVAFRGRLAWLCWNDTVRPAPAEPSNRATSVEERIAAAESAALRRLQSIRKSILDQQTHSQPARLAAVLGAFDELASREALALTAIRFDGDINIEGVTLGTSAAESVTAAVGNAGLTSVTVQTANVGDCRSFSIKGTLSGEETSRSPSGSEIFDDRTAEHCSQPPAPALKPIAARGSGGPLHFHLREGDLSDVFRILHELTGENFLVASDVKGTISVESDGATLDEILAGMKGLRISSGPLHLVRQANVQSTIAAPKETSYAGEPIGLSLKNADLKDVFCLFARITGLKYRVPEKLDRRVTAFVREMPWDLLFATMISSAGLSYTIDEDRVLIGTEPRVDACDALDLQRTWWRVRPEQLSPQDLKLAGLASVDGTWKAFAYVPGSSRTLLTLELKAKVGDAEVSAVGPDGVTFKRVTGQAVVLRSDHERSRVP